MLCISMFISSCIYLSWYIFRPHVCIKFCTKRNERAMMIQTHLLKLVIQSELTCLYSFGYICTEVGLLWVIKCVSMPLKTALFFQMLTNENKWFIPRRLQEQTWKITCHNTTQNHNEVCWPSIREITMVKNSIRKNWTLKMDNLNYVGNCGC